MRTLRTPARAAGLAALVASAVLAGMGAGPAAASHYSATAVKGSAYGYFVSVALFGGAPNVTGPTPTVTLAADASNSPQNVTVASGSATAGPARMFSSGQISVGTSGSLGPSGTAGATTSVSNVNTSQSEVFTATGITSSCTATGAGASGSVSVTGGTLQTDSGDDANGDGDYTDPGDHPPVTVSLPTNPAAGTQYEGHIHVNGSVDNFRYRFNEQITNADGSKTIYSAHQELLGPTAIGHVYIGKSECGLTKVVGKHPAPPNFDGDGDTDRSVFRNGAWYAQGQATAFLGQSGDIPVPADYDGDGDSERAVYRNGAWHIDGQATVFHGLPTDIPVPGDYDGDGDAEPAVYRPSIGGWFILGQPTVFLGLSTDIPVPGRYDTDTDTDPAIWRPSVGGWYVAGQTTQFLGFNGDIPVPGDYDASGDTERAVWRPGVGGWYVEGQATAFVGLNGDRPVPGDYDGDGDADRGVWRPSVGGWYVENQTTAFVGVSGDIPLPLPNAIFRSFF